MLEGDTVFNLISVFLNHVKNWATAFCVYMVLFCMSLYVYRPAYFHDETVL